VGVAFWVGWVAVSAGASTSGDTAKVARATRPQLLSLRYGRFRPKGAPHAYFALKLRVYERGGQVVETDFHELPSGFNADGSSGCGIGGRKSGRVETFFMPVSPPLAHGSHRVRVTAVGSSCRQGGAPASTTRAFKVTVP
jgi:hypothetical protein